MEATPIVDIALLTREARTYQNDLRFYPYVVLREELGRLGIRLLQTAQSDKEISFERKGGILKPYSPGKDIAYSELGRFREMELKLEDGYAAMKDHLKNYKTKNVLNNASMAGSGYNQTKKHPIQSLFTGQSVITFSEDVQEALFGAKRDEDDQSPLGTFDGFDEKISGFIVAGEIAEAYNNLIPTGAIVDPVDDTDFTAIDKIVVFVRAAHSELRKKPALLYLPNNVYWAASDALEHKYKYKDITIAMIEAYINQKANSKVIVTVSQLFGKGDRITLTGIGNYDFGMNTLTDMNFVDVRNPWEDPNLVQYWLQAEFGTRIRSIHPKLFAVNDGTPDHTELTLSGDYKS